MVVAEKSGISAPNCLNVIEHGKSCSTIWIRLFHAMPGSKQEIPVVGGSWGAAGRIY